jgi:hypothetical protein
MEREQPARPCRQSCLRSVFIHSWSAAGAWRLLCKWNMDVQDKQDKNLCSSHFHSFVERRRRMASPIINGTLINADDADKSKNICVNHENLRPIFIHLLARRRRVVS